MALPQSDTAVLKQYFGMDLAEAKRELTSGGGLTAQDRAQLVGGIRNGSLTYEPGQLKLLGPAPTREERKGGVIRDVCPEGAA
jgi:hypothetical protein